MNAQRDQSHFLVALPLSWICLVVIVFLFVLYSPDFTCRRLCLALMALIGSLFSSSQADLS